jgi:hypothetical protein
MSKEPEQIPLIDKGEWWDEHWKAMPEFVQKNERPFKTIKVHFASRADMDKFAAFIGQQIGQNTQYIWYPEAELAKVAHMRYVDDPDEDDENVEVLGEGSE